jgi:hypothetical protein
MKAYIAVTGGVFGLLALVHIARLFAEGARLLTEPFFLITTGVSIGACVWAIALLRKRHGAYD